MTTFSFHPVKHIAAGEGGMITTKEEGIYRRLLRLRSHGINKEGDEFLNTQAAFEGGELNRWYYEMQELGFNFRLTDIQCALALSQFSKLDRFVFKRNQLAIFYDEAFSDFKSLRSAQLQQAGSHAYHLYVLRVNFKLLKISRTRFMARLAGNGIGTQVHYLPSYLHPYYQSRSAPAKCPEAEKYYEEALSIPIFFDLPEAGQRRAISQICELVK
jgi:dTDP-4-amino-4,6-dideoxygalactose transaminase